MKKSSQKIQKFIYLSIATAIATIALKAVTYYLTKSVGLLSDALESGVNLTAAIVALIMHKISSRPADKKHNFGLGKAEYFSSIIEGSLILVAAGSILYLAIPKLINPQPLENINLGFIISLVASGLNLITAQILIRQGRKYRSIILEADGKHLMADVWTSVGVLIGVVLVKLTGFNLLDPILAILVAAHIIKEGVELVSRSIEGLLDIAIPETERQKIEQYLDSLKQEDIGYHKLKTRQSGSKWDITLHLLVPDDWTIYKAHQKSHQVQAEIVKMFDNRIFITIHIEPKSHSLE